MRLLMTWTGPVFVATSPPSISSLGYIFGNEQLDMCIQLLKKWELKMNRYTHKCLLQAHLCARDSGNGLQVYHDTTRKGYYPIIFAYNILLNALGKDQKFLRYVDTRPNGEALRKCILSGPYKPTTVLVHAVEETNDSPVVPEHTTVETPTNMSLENKAHF
nr:pentatricopeptide repeat-containing protein At1g51965, mitochondrial [Tanacetum cinerariifolium]